MRASASSNQSALILSAHTGTFFDGGGGGGTTGIGGGRGALGDVERLICCSEITVQAISADTFINDLLTYPFGASFNYPVKSRTKYTPKDLKNRRSKLYFRPLKNISNVKKIGFKRFSNDNGKYLGFVWNGLSKRLPNEVLA